jgi:hypothetical protein
MPTCANLRTSSLGSPVSPHNFSLKFVFSFLLGLLLPELLNSECSTKKEKLKIEAFGDCNMMSR